MRVGSAKPPSMVPPARAEVPKPRVASVCADAFTPSPVQEIALTGPITNPELQISGMAWHGQELLLLPQCVSSLFVLEKRDVLRQLDGAAPSLEPRQLPVRPSDFHDALPGSEGFEAMAVVGNTVYLVVEAKQGEEMFGYLVSGTLTPTGLELDVAGAQRLPSATRIQNMGYEALVVSGDRLLVMPEANATATGPRTVHAFDLSLRPLGPLAMPSLDYRLTDATAADTDGRFWAANYNHPGDAGMPEAPRVEQLLPLSATPEGVRVAGPALVISTDGTEKGRNWEALAKLDERGFLLMTDQHPRTILGFLPR